MRSRYLLAIVLTVIACQPRVRKIDLAYSEEPPTYSDCQVPVFCSLVFSSRSIGYQSSSPSGGHVSDHLAGEVR